MAAASGSIASYRLQGIRSHGASGRAVAREQGDAKERRGDGRERHGIEWRDAVDHSLHEPRERRRAGQADHHTDDAEAYSLAQHQPHQGTRRRTERERIGGTDTRRGDLDESRLVEEYDATFEAEEKLGVYDVHRILLVAKPGVDVAFPKVRMWVDRATLNVLKRQELALSGRLMRTAYYPRWKKLFSPSKGADVWYPEEMRLFDEIEKGNSTLILIKEIDLRPLAANLFTKAWLESKSR